MVDATSTVDTTLAVASSRVSSRAHPTSGEMQDWSTVSDVMQWLGLKIDDQQGTIETALLEHMGLAVDTPIRDLALIQAEDFESELQESYV